MIIDKYVIPFLTMTSWRMYRPHIGGFVHVFGFTVVALIAVCAAIYVSGATGQGSYSRRGAGSGSPYGSGARHYSSAADRKRIRILAFLGWLMLVSEIYKQLFFYYIVNGEVYDWWFFPFQLCSVPMYLCILLPFVSDRTKSIFLTFMTGFTFISAVAALIYPEDMLRPYISLTVHGFVWHGILLFISIMIGLSGMADLTLKGFLKSAAFFLVLCALAIAINVIAEPIAAANPIEPAAGLTTGAGSGVISYPNMFYLSPYHTSNQPFVDIVENTYGRLPAMAAYVAAIIALAGVVDLIFRLLSGKR